MKEKCDICLHLKHTKRECALHWFTIRTIRHYYHEWSIQNGLFHTEAGGSDLIMSLAYDKMIELSLGWRQRFKALEPTERRRLVLIHTEDDARTVCEHGIPSWWHWGTGTSLDGFIAWVWENRVDVDPTDLGCELYEYAQSIKKGIISLTPDFT